MESTPIVRVCRLVEDSIIVVVDEEEPTPKRPRNED